MQIIAVQGIGPANAKKMIKAGLRSTEALLKKGGSPQGRKEIAKNTGISHELILRWVNHADLYRIKGIGPQYAELLEKAGVDSVIELSKRTGEHLYKKMVESNHPHKTVRELPGEKRVKGWIAAAKKLPRAISY